MPQAPSEVAQFPQVKVQIRKLKFADYNPRSMPKEEMAKLRRSLEEFGFVEPVVARAEDLLLIGGHQRVLAAKGLLGGKASIPAILVPGLSDVQAKQLNVALNRIGGEWDYQKLSELLASLPAADQILTGFDQREIDEILALAGEPPPVPTGEGIDVDGGIAAQARRFVFEVSTDGEADECRAVLRDAGMTGPGNAGAAFLKVCRTAKARRRPLS